MDALITARVDADLKGDAIAILEQHGYTISSSVRELFNYVTFNNTVPFGKMTVRSNERIVDKIRRFERLTVNGVQCPKGFRAYASVPRLEEKYENSL